MLAFVAVASPCRAAFGDFLVPNKARVAVYAGPDRGFEIRTHIDPSHVVTEKKRIRGFVYIVIPQQSHLTGYVRARDLDLVPETEANSADSAGNDGRSLPIYPGLDNQVASTRWNVWVFSAIVALFALLAVVLTSVGLYLHAGYSRDEALAQWLLALQRTRSAQAARLRRLGAKLRTAFSANEARSHLRQADPPATDDAELYLRASRQFEAGEVVPALWAKAMTLAEGDAETAKYKYIGLLVADMAAQAADPRSSDAPQ